MNSTRSNCVSDNNRTVANLSSQPALGVRLPVAVCDAEGRSAGNMHGTMPNATSNSCSCGASGLLSGTAT